MILTLHGTGAGVPNRHRLASCISIAFPDGEIVVIDAGEGCSRAMVRDGIDLDQIIAVTVSHMHADHWAGLPGLATAWFAFDRKRPVDLFLPPGTLGFFANQFLNGYLLPEKRQFDIRYHELRPISLPSGWNLQLFDTTHLSRVAEMAARYGLQAIARGYVLAREDSRIVISGDIGAAEDLDPVLPDARLLICESAHVSPIAVLERAAELNVAQVIFTHVPDDEVEFPESFDRINWSVAEDGLRVVIA
jgi:ribonuclease BN (tRNA processing enzyme)